MTLNNQKIHQFLPFCLSLAKFTQDRCFCRETPHTCKSLIHNCIFLVKWIIIFYFIFELGKPIVVSKEDSFNKKVDIQVCIF